MPLRAVSVCRRLACLAICFLAVAAYGQDPASSTQVYDRTYFEKYDVVTAEDMVRRVPGAAAILDSGGNQQERGFGSSGDQVLLNGKRFAGKGQVLSTLQRIQSATVVRIELIRGTAAEASVLSEGLIVNVVLEEGAGTGAGSWQATARFNDRGRVNGDGLVSYSDSWGPLDYNLALKRNVWSTGSRPDPLNKTRLETYFYPNGAVREARREEFVNTTDQYIATANLSYNFQNGNRFRLNGRFEPRNVRQDSDAAFTRFDANGAAILQAIDISRTHVDWEKQWEVGGDYEAALGNGRRFNFLFIHTNAHNPTIEFRNLELGTRVVELSRSITNQTEIESILRGSLTLPLFTGQTLEVGAEGARNVLRQRFRPFFDLNGDGTVEEIAIPTANARVQELRGELFANHSWNIRSDLSLSSSATLEASRISNNYPFSPKHTYIYPKPRIDLRYDLTPSDQLRFKVERFVSQLDFGNFVPEFDIIDSEIDAGNPNLKPEREWEFEIGYEKELPGDQGLTKVRAFYKDIQDHIDKFILRVEPDGRRISAEGNIGGGHHYGVEATPSVRLTALGLPDVVVDTRFTLNFSRTRDPFTGLMRPIGRSENGGEHWRYAFDIGFRHDVTAWGFSYGLKYDKREGELIGSDIRVQDFESQGSRFQAFAEKKLTGGLALRVEGFGLMPKRTQEYQRRIVYSDDIIRGTLSRTEYYIDRFDRLFLVSLRGTF